MGRKILFITTDQMRFDAIGANGQKIARTPNIDALARTGINYTRCHAQNVVCMPARATMITGQYVTTHGVWMNGVPLPEDAPSVARLLKEQKNYRTALIGKAHFEPFLDLQLKYYENRMGREGTFGPHRGFDHMELAAHGARGPLHYAQWLMKTHPEVLDNFFPVLGPDFAQNSFGEGDTGAVQVKHNATPRGLYHTDWVADRTVAYLDSLDAKEDWFVWMSFPDPHHPWDPPQSELHRHNWRDLPVPDGYPGSAAKIDEILSAKPKHWREWWTGERMTCYEAPPKWAPSSLTTDQLREIDAMTHIKNELIDDAVGRVMAAIAARGWDGDTDVIFSTDHGEFQGDFGLLFKGPHHVDSLMRLPLIWRPAPNAHVAPAAFAAPVGQVDFAPTFCEIAGVEKPDWMEGAPLPRDATAAAGREAVFTEWDSEFKDVSISLRTLHRDGWTITAYGKTSTYEGTEGELYDLRNDPKQWRNLWDEPSDAAMKKDLLADLRARTPKGETRRRKAETFV
ncbi:MAG TPA: sulfatase-like hydrolase/transferase [Rhizomicrobium sp.]|nr:sulfatase-like hydrolase/transferase [Rhizomicrobium sp.]